MLTVSTWFSFFFQLTFLGPFLDGDPVHISQCHVLRHKGARCEAGISEMWQTHQDRSLDLFGFAEADVALQIMRPQDQSEDPIFRAARLQVCFVLILLPCRRRNWMELARPKNDIHEETCHRNSSDRCSLSGVDSSLWIGRPASRQVQLKTLSGDQGKICIEGYRGEIKPGLQLHNHTKD